MDFKKAGCLGLMAYSEAFERDFPVKKTKAVQSIATLNSPGAAGSLLGDAELFEQSPGYVWL